MDDTYSRLMAAAHAGAFGINEMELPTAEQCRAGNYRKGRVTVQGLPLVIEVPQGQRRMGKSDGKPWSTILMAHYGYIAATQGADGDALDVFVGPVPESTRVWVVNQIGKGGAFDEHKILLGFIDRESALAAYRNSYERGWTGMGDVVACSINQLKWWVKYGNTAIPLTERALPHDGNSDMSNEIVWDSAGQPVGLEVVDLIYRLRQGDAEGLLLDAVTLADIMEESEGEAALDALVVEYVQAERKAEQLRKVMDALGGDVTVPTVQVTAPFKQRGTTNVVFLYELSDGQTVSVWMHNPDNTPNKILPTDELVSWRWLLNKKDITVLVAPERGQDLKPREVATRIMRLAAKNSARFAKANGARAERMSNIERMRSEVTDKEAELASLDAQHADLTEKVEAKRARKPATLETNDQEGATRPEPEFDPTTPEGYEKATQDEQLQIAHQDQLDSFFQGRLIDVRNALRDLGWEGERYKPLSKTASTGDVWQFEPRYKQVGGGANIVEFYPQLYIYRNGQKVTTENWATEDRLTLTPEALAKLIDSVVPQTKADPQPEPAPEPDLQPKPEPSGEGSEDGKFNATASRTTLKAAKAFAATCEGETKITRVDLPNYSFYYEIAYNKKDKPKGGKKTIYHTLPDGGVATVTTARDYTHIIAVHRIGADGQTEWGYWGWSQSAESAEKTAKTVITRTDWQPQVFEINNLGSAKGSKPAKEVGGAMPEPEPQPEAQQTKSEWEGEVAEIIAETMSITTSDAQGIVQAQDFYMTQSWGKGMTAQQTAEKIMAESGATSAANEALTEALAFLQTVVDGQVDFMDEGLADQLEKMHDDFAGDEGFMPLFEKAAQAYSDYMVQQARNALA